MFYELKVCKIWYEIHKNICCSNFQISKKWKPSKVGLILNFTSAVDERGLEGSALRQEISSSKIWCLLSAYFIICPPQKTKNSIINNIIILTNKINEYSRICFECLQLLGFRGRAAQNVEHFVLFSFHEINCFSIFAFYVFLVNSINLLIYFLGPCLDILIYFFLC